LLRISCGVMSILTGLEMQLVVLMTAVLLLAVFSCSMVWLSCGHLSGNPPACMFSRVLKLRLLKSSFQLAQMFKKSSFHVGCCLKTLNWIFLQRPLLVSLSLQNCITALPRRISWRRAKDVTGSLAWPHPWQSEPPPSSQCPTRLLATYMNFMLMLMNRTTFHCS
jgi:hypothetical protein